MPRIELLIGRVWDLGMFRVDHGDDSISRTDTCHNLIVLDVLLDELTQQLCANENARKDDTRSDWLPCQLFTLNAILDELHKLKNDEGWQEIE